MSGKGLLIAAVLLILLGGAAYWSEQRKKAEDAKPAADAAPKLGQIAENDVQRFEILKAGQPPLTAEKDQNGKWRMTAPLTLAADEDAANGVASTVTGLTWDRLVEDKAGDLSQYGLNNPALRVTVSAKGGKKQTLLIGDETPTSGGFYAKLEGDPRVFTVYSGTKTTLDKSPRDLRDKRLLTFSEEKLTRLELAAKGQQIELGKDNQGDWQILRPRPLRADGGQVDELLRKLRDAKIDTAATAEDDKKAPGAFASGSRVAVVRATDPSGAQQLEVRKSGDSFYARSSVVEGVFKIPNDAAQGLDKGLDDLRNKKVFDFGFNDPSRVQVKDADKQYAFEKSGENWMSGGKQMDATSVQMLIDKLRDLAAAGFPESEFTTPVLEITVVSNSGKRTERVAISKGGKGYIARRENEPALYELEAGPVDEIRRAAADVKPAPPPKPAGKK